MQLARPSFAMHPTRFGRGQSRFLETPAAKGFSLSPDVQLFGTTFLVGFVFVSVLIA